MVGTIPFENLKPIGRGVSYFTSNLNAYVPSYMDTSVLTQTTAYFHLIAIITNIFGDKGGMVLEIVNCKILSLS